MEFSPITFVRGMPDLVNLVYRMFPPSIEYLPRGTSLADACRTITQAVQRVRAADGDQR